MSVQKAEAVFDFQPTASVELKLKKGDVVVVRRMSVGEGWWEGEFNGKRGLFPSSYVKLLPIPEGVSERPREPLTPKTSKKAFMETLLTPAHHTQEEIYDPDRAAELFVPGHTNIEISVGPRWNCRPPTLTVVIKDLQTETRFSGMKQYTVFEVETKELGACVTRKYKQFLALYDRLAECFPCVSLPPIPIKQFSGSSEPEGMEIRRRGLERFLTRIANHPLLGSTKLFRDFLSVKDDKDWKIGRHISHKLLSKTGKKLFQAPVYAIVKYPPYNVPLTQLTSIEKFERFSRLLEMNVGTIQYSYHQLNLAYGDVMSTLNLLGRDFQRFARGMQPTTGAQRRKLQAMSSHPGGLADGHSAFYTPSPRSAAELEEESDGEEGEGASWNWREDSRFNGTMKDLQDMASGVRHMSRLYQNHQDSLEHQVTDTLKEYSGIIHTLPVLVRLHEDAMETFNTSKEKDTKKEAEEVRQNCETLNNILLAEFDYFSNIMADDVEAMVGRFLLQQAEFHRKLADEWESLHTRYTERIARHQAASGESPMHSSPFLKPKRDHSTCTTSSEASFGVPQTRDLDAMDSSSKTDSEMESSGPSPPVPKYVNIDVVANMISESKAKSPELNGRPVSDGAKASPFKYQIPGVSFTVRATDEELPYENWDVALMHDTQKPVQTPDPQKTVPKRPMPIQRKVAEPSTQRSGSKSPTSPKKMPLMPKSASVDQQPSKPLPQNKKVSDTLTSSYPQRRPAPPPPPSRFRPMSEFPASSKMVGSSVKKQPGKSTNGASNSESQNAPNREHGGMKMPNPKPRSYTTNLDRRNLPEKKQPLLPPAKPPPPAYKPSAVKPPQTIPEDSETESRTSMEGSTEVGEPCRPGTDFCKPGPPKFTKAAATPASSKSIAVPTSTSKDSPTKASRSLSNAVSASSGGSGGGEELMRKLSMRRMKIEQQIASTSKPISGSTHSSLSADSSDKDSTCSNHSELVCTYRRTGDSPDSLENSAFLRKTEDKEGNLAKYGIIEDEDGGSYVI